VIKLDVNKVESLIENRNFYRLIHYLETFKRASRVTPSNKNKHCVLNTINSLLNDKGIMDTADCFFSVGSPTSLELAAHLYSKVYLLNRRKVNQKLLYIADHENWEVREWAAGACASVLKSHFFDYIEVLESDWVKSDSENIRRTVVVALKYVSKDKKKIYEDKIFRIIDVLMGDNSSYVKKNLGAFAIGDGLLKYYPETTIKKIKEWSLSENQQVRWNVAKIFSSAEGMNYQEIGKTILYSYLDDENDKVRRAAKSTLRKWEKNE
jgi:HEAT repeat protein